MTAKWLWVSLVSLFTVTCCLAPPPPGTVLWTYDVESQGVSTISAPAALGIDGTIYLGTYDGLLALTNAGSSASDKWTFPAPSVSGISVAFDGTIYLANASLYFYAINPDGSQKWAYPFASYGSRQPAVGRDGTIYVVGDDSLYALTPGGIKKWAYKIWDHHGIPVIADDGTIYVRNGQSPFSFFAINPAGTLKWSTQLGFGGGWSDVAPAIGADGTVYIGDLGLHAFEQQGAELWLNPTNGFFGPVVSQQGNIYANNGTDSTLYALRQTGEYMWRAGFAERCGFRYCLDPATPAIDTAGNLYYTAPNSIYSITSDGQIRWSVPHPNPGGHPVLGTTSPVIAPDGTIYATLTNRLFAIAGTNGPADAPWPMFQQNAQHTGKVEKPALKNPARRSDVNFQFQLFAQLGQTNLIETTTDLRNWVSLTNIVITNVPMDVADLTASNSPTRFYRSIAR